MAVTGNNIVTPQIPLSGTAVATTANTNYSAPTQTVALIPTQTNGARITKLTAITQATVTATECQLYSSPDGGTTKRFIKSKLMLAYTVAQTSENTATDFGYSDTSPLVLLAGESLYAAIGVTQTGVVFRAEGGAY